MPERFQIDRASPLPVYVQLAEQIRLLIHRGALGPGDPLPTVRELAVALDVAHEGIRVNAVCPGIIDTAMRDRFSGGTAEGRQGVIAQEPVGRMGKPEEIAAAVLYLCSDAAKNVRGVAWNMDGGWVAQ